MFDKGLGAGGRLPWITGQQQLTWIARSEAAVNRLEAQRARSVVLLESLILSTLYDYIPGVLETVKGFDDERLQPTARLLLSTLPGIRQLRAAASPAPRRRSSCDAFLWENGCGSAAACCWSGVFGVWGRAKRGWQGPRG